LIRLRKYICLDEYVTGDVNRYVSLYESLLFSNGSYL